MTNILLIQACQKKSQQPPKQIEDRSDLPGEGTGFFFPVKTKMFHTKISLY